MSGPGAVVAALCLIAAGLAGCAGQQQETQAAASGAAEVGTMDWRPQDCAAAGEGPPAIHPDVAERLAAYAETPIAADLGHLDARQRQVLDKLVEAAAVMDDLFREQACPCCRELQGRLAALEGPGAAAAREYFALNFGPWDRRFDREPFVGDWPHPAGANFYPLDLSEEEAERIRTDSGPLASLHTMVRRDAEGKLIGVPYSAYFAEGLGRAAALLREAAGLTENESLAAFLRARADAFLSDDYYESDMLWMDIDGPIEITIGPYETYEDGLLGYKAAFEAFVTVVDPAESARLDRYKGELPWLESQLPLPDRHKNPNRGSESPISVVDEVFSAGDTKAGIQTIAFNLPNDERVREAKGSKKVMLRNVMNAKFERILTPIAQAVVAPEQVGDLSGEAFFLHTLLHEMSHGLGPGRIEVAGRQTEVRLELRDLYSTIEEAKADAMGEWAIFKLADKGYFESDVVRRQAATYLAGLFRSVRFGIAEAHGQANAIQYTWLREKGIIGHDEASGRFTIDAGRFPAAIEQLVGEIALLQAEGDYEAAAEMVRRYAVMPPELESALGRLGGIPVDIRPVFALGPPR